MVKESAIKFDSASQYGALSGSLAGAGLSGLLSWLYYRKKKNQSLKSRILKSLGWMALGGAAGAAGGAYAGRMYARHSAYNELKNKISKDLEGTEKVPGRVIYIDCINNRHLPKDGMGRKVLEKVTDGGLPTGHSMMAVIDDKTKTLQVYQVNTSDPKATKNFGYSLMKGAKRPDGTFDRDQVIRGYNAVRMAEAGGTPLLHKTDDVQIGNASNEDLALYIGGIAKDMGFGDRVVLHEGAKVGDIRLPVRYMLESYNNTLRDGGGGYSAVPGGYNCGTAAREAFDVAQPSQASHWRDMLWGGGSTANAPSFVKKWDNTLSANGKPSH